MGPCLLTFASRTYIYFFTAGATAVAEADAEELALGTEEATAVGEAVTTTSGVDVGTTTAVEEFVESLLAGASSQPVKQKALTKRVTNVNDFIISPVSRSNRVST